MIETPEIPEGNLSVTAGEIREITERLFHTASGISLAEWSPMANNLLGAASRIEQECRLRDSLTKLVEEWRLEAAMDKDLHPGLYMAADQLQDLIK